MPPVVYALLLNYNSSEDSIDLYEQLSALKMNELKVLVIDNNSVESQRNILSEHIPKDQIIFNAENLGYAGGNNLGITCALNNNADYIWILNPDIRIEDTTLNILLNTISQDETLAAVGPRICHRKDHDLIFSDGELLEMNEMCSTSHKNHNLNITGTIQEINYNVDYIDGSSILINSLALKDVGNLCEDYFLYFEETDWCLRARNTGWKLAVDTSAVVYNSTSPKNGLFHYYMIRNRLIFSKKFHPDFNKVRKHYIKVLFKEMLNRWRGNYFKPFYLERLKGLISGILKTI